MILNVWRPRISKSKDVEKVIKHYELVEIDDFIKEQKKGWVVVYKCDKCNENVRSTTSHSLFSNKSKYNTINFQMCRECRGVISEYEIKKNFIGFEEIKESLNGSNYILTTTKDEYMNSRNRSQFKINVVCDNGHILHVTWNNWVKGKRCRMCYEEKKFENAIKHKHGYNRYKFLVDYYTQKNYKNHYELINPNNYKRGLEYHLDHKYSINEGFKNNISPIIIGSKENLEILTSNENLSKNSKCSITLEELLLKTEYLLKNK